MITAAQPWLEPFHGRFIRADAAIRIRARTQRAPTLTPEQQDILRALLKPSKNCS